MPTSSLFTIYQEFDSFTLQGCTLSVHTTHPEGRPTSPQLLQQSKPDTSVQAYYKQNMTFKPTFRQFIPYLPYINRLLMPFLTLQGWDLSIQA